LGLLARARPCPTVREESLGPFVRTWEYQQEPWIPGTLTPAKARAARIPAHERATAFASTMAAEGLSRAALARRLGVSRAWVTKALRALPRVERTAEQMNQPEVLPRRLAAT
jgi:hypothetical protein